ncbi:MAG TPA: hypothetical protein VGR03_18505 [Candidatus Acidoferrum sp.]|nr:hypothetical protein [Candidatus Acidoferrum sp.]
MACSSPALDCASGSGASEITQQVLLAGEIAGRSACSIAIRSQCVSVWGVAHSLGCEEITAQAESGKGPNPTRPSAMKKLRILRIFYQSTTGPANGP